MNEFLPLGSVVLLKTAKRYVVVIGYAPVEEGKHEVWDYLGCAYPIGVIGAKQNLLFNHDNIEKVVHRGFEDDEGKKFLDTLGQEMGKIK